MEINDPVVICLVHKRGGDHEICRCLIICDRDVVDLGDTKKRLHVRIVGLGSQGIGEENNEVDAPLHDLRADLLVTAERTAVIALTGRPVASVIILAVVPVPHRKCPFKISLFASHHSIISCFLLSWAIRAMFFCLPMVSVRKSIEIPPF